GGPWIDRFRGHRLILVPVGSAKGFANLVTVHTAWNHFALPIEFNFVSADEPGNLQRSFEWRGAALFAGERALVGRIAAMNCEGGLKRVFVAGGRFVLRILLVSPRTVPAVNGAVAIEK